MRGDGHPLDQDTANPLPCTHLVPSVPQSINRAMQKPYEEYSVGVLDIYGFEIFQVCVAVL